MTALLAAAVAMIMVPRLRAGIEYRALLAAVFEPESAKNAEAIAFFSTRIDPEDPLSEMRFFLIDGLDERIGVLNDSALRSVHGAFAGSRAFASRFPDAHLRAISLKLEESNGPRYAGYALAQTSSTYGAEDDHARAIFDSLQAHEDASIRRQTIEHACWRLGPAALAYVEAGARDPSPEVARASWLMLPHLDPPGGYPANYLDIPTGVGEAVLLAATLLGGDEALELLDQAESSGGAALAESVVYCRALLDSHEAVVLLESVGGYAEYTVEKLRELEPSVTDLRRRALIRSAITAREPNDAGVDEALLLAQDGLLDPREMLGALLHAGEARRVMRVLLASSDDERSMRGDQGNILRKYFLEKDFRVPVPGVIPDGPRSRTLAFDALRAWWMCVGNRAVFDANTREYALETPAKTGKAPRD